MDDRMSYSHGVEQSNEQHFLEQPKVLVLDCPAIFSFHEKKFEKKFHLLKAWESPLPMEEFLKNHARSVKVILSSFKTRITADILNLLPWVELIACESTGVENIDLVECRKRGITVTNAASAFVEDVADMAIGLLLAVLMKIPAADRDVRFKLWPQNMTFPVGHFKLREKQVGIVGLGNIGLQVAKRLEAFGCSISYTSRKEKHNLSSYKYYPKTQELAINCKILIVCCALTDQTHHIINRNVMEALGKDGIVINVGRGPLIDEKELVKFLVEGKIGGAGLDVFEKEPYVPNELVELDNVVLTPHRAGFTEQAFFDDFQLLVGNIESVFSTTNPLMSPVMELV
ncbi:glyoxylate/hydroxypyruvate reductase HPR3-like [Lycium barbarum]|uniref:glyoxylate/hydroxypyruvate reductase HPR3-like n=1 Tax=Lycium barbarum TaxID=112863 RepID=UPI00293EE605|nr:glyoxylate/hydroxypyruvate reductase HPR3-like [Lycium barbarum]